jgi:hypothetical protein
VCLGVNRRLTSFLARVGPVHFRSKKRAVTRHTDLEFLHPVGSAGHVVHSGASEVRNIDTLLFRLG